MRYDDEIMGDYDYDEIMMRLCEIMSMSVRYGSSTFVNTSVGSKGAKVTLGSESEAVIGHDEGTHMRAHVKLDESWTQAPFHDLSTPFLPPTQSCSLQTLIDELFQRLT